MTLNTKKHYWLFAGAVVHQDAQARMPVNFNTLVTTEKKMVSRRDLEIGQQALQIRFRREVPIENPNIVDVFIISVSYLGHMNEAEFNHGMADLQKEHEAAVAESVKGETPQ